MFGSKQVGVRDVVFDSQEEALVAEHLEVLRHEQIVANYFAHPVIAGFVTDFLVQMGASSWAPGRMIIFEYDGLGPARRESLSEKVLRYGEMGAFGLMQTWATSATYDAVRKALEEPGRPHLSRKILRCPQCGQERSIYVIGGEGVVEEQVCHEH